MSGRPTGKQGKWPVKWNAKESSKLLSCYAQTLIQTNSGTILSPRNMKLDAKKDFEVCQGELGNKFSRS